ncbi:MAG: response regulator transcription factor [Oscillospiraceae bacterium]|jgi:two-component system alkaline phosphatase synthesis response regulator PhoP
MKQTIIVVEDDDAIRTMLEYYLKSVGFDVRGFSSGESLFEAEHIDIPSLYILDIMLPGMDGLEILRRIRHNVNTMTIPILMLTARSSELDKVAGLEGGADDYMGKPFGIMELGARVKALLRRAAPTQQERLFCGALEMNVAAREVREHDIPIDLTYKEFELLRLLLSRKGSVLTRDEILQSVWGYDFTGETRTVDMHVKTLRQKLSEDYIQTVRGVGYKIP